MSSPTHLTPNLELTTSPPPLLDTPKSLGSTDAESVLALKLSDAIRLGAKDTTQAYNWGDGIETACALTAASIVIREMGYEQRNPGNVGSA